MTGNWGLRTLEAKTEEKKMDKGFNYQIQDEYFWQFAIKLILGALLAPFWILMMPFRNSFWTS